MTVGAGVEAHTRAKLAQLRHFWALSVWTHLAEADALNPSCRRGQMFEEYESSDEEDQSEEGKLGQEPGLGLGQEPGLGLAAFLSSKLARRSS